jgi:phytol kinase
MDLITHRTLAFFAENFPSWRDILIGTPLGALWSYLCLYFAGYVKKQMGYKTGYTRKIFHFLIFASVVLIQLVWDTSTVCLFGAACTLVIFHALGKGSGNLLYEAIAREKDEPHRTHYIVVPYFATLFGGLASNILFGHIALVGYLVTGLADAAAEPVGTRFGTHTYRVPSLTSVRANRSWEGSVAVFVLSAAAVAVSISLVPELRFTNKSFLLLPLLGLVSAGVEALSPHGWDNATLQVIPSFLAWQFFVRFYG